VNSAVHHYFGGMAPGLGAPCGQGANLVHSLVGGVLSSSGSALMKPPQGGTTADIGTGQLIAGAVLTAASVIQNFFGHPDCSKIATTQIVNQAELMLQQNLAAWQGLSPADKTPATQAQALQNFDAVWQQVVQACAGYGSAGQACVADRQRGGCHYQNNGQCWNWFVGYRDPIATDPQVATNPVGSLLSSTGIDPNLLLVLGAAGLLAVVVLS
jgi:hypothetical protein